MKLKVRVLVFSISLFPVSLFAATSVFTHVLPMSCESYQTSANNIQNRLTYMIHKYQFVGTTTVACQVDIPFEYNLGDTALIRIKEFGILHQDPDGTGTGHYISASLYAQSHNSWMTYLKASVSSNNTNSTAMTWTKVYPNNVTSSILDPLFIKVHMKRSAGNSYPTFRHARVVVEYVPSNVMILNRSEKNVGAVPYPEEAKIAVQEIELPNLQYD